MTHAGFYSGRGKNRDLDACQESRPLVFGPKLKFIYVCVSTLYVYIVVYGVYKVRCSVRRFEYRLDETEIYTGRGGAEAKAE